MEMPEIVALSQRLARPCTLLKRSGPENRFAAVWGGVPVVECPDEPYRHWISLDCRFFPEELGPLTGVISVFTNEDDCVSGVVTYDSSAKLVGPAKCRLFAHDGLSLPPPDALPLESDDPYREAWQSNCPIYTNDVVAVLGGWHFPWPDGDWHELREKPLLLWTIEGSEPWVEVWKEPEGFRVIQRMT